jgi:hypothetical protein
MMSHHHRSHAEWDSVPFEAGSYTVTGYDKSGKVVGTKTVSSTGKPATLRASIRDGVGATLYAGCGDMALIQVRILFDRLNEKAACFFCLCDRWAP